MKVDIDGKATDTAAHRLYSTTLPFGPPAGAARRCFRWFIWMWKVLGNASLDESSAVPRQPQRRAAVTAPPPPLATASVDGSTKNLAGTSTSINNTRKGQQGAAVPETNTSVTCGKYRITGTMRKGATGYLYSAVGGVGGGGVGGGAGVVLKVEEVAAPKRQMHNEWQVRDRYIAGLDKDVLVWVYSAGRCRLRLLVLCALVSTIILVCIMELFFSVPCDPRTVRTSFRFGAHTVRVYY